MGLLTPLYALAALAIAGPIIFHLIRRQPKGRTDFSSLIFLSPSPPQLTRRSRLDNLLLLLLRGLAIGLIALAFARPYLRQASWIDSDLDGRNVILLLDTSASMQRTGVWEKAMSSANELLEELSTNDRLALYTIDDRLRSVVPLAAVDSLETTDSGSVPRVRRELESVEPGFGGSNLAMGLNSLADLVSSQRLQEEGDSASHHIVLISDLQRGAELESLQGVSWPEDLPVDVRQILPETRGNARPTLLDEPTASIEIDSDSAAGRRLRIENEPDSQRQDFQYGWADATGRMIGQALSITVPAGQVRVVKLEEQPIGADRLLLTGDAWDDDNTVYVPQVERSQQQILCFEPAREDNKERLGYFLSQAPLDTPRFIRQVSHRRLDFEDTAQFRAMLEDPTVFAAVVDLSAAAPRLAPALRDFCDRGGIVLACFSGQRAAPRVSRQWMAALSDDLQQSEDAALETGSAESAAEEDEDDTAEDYRLVSYVDFSHRVFAPFASPKYSDFSKLRILRHTPLQLEESSAWRVIARLDDGSPWLMQHRIGEGTAWVIASSWRSSDSNFALSSKFVPMLLKMLELASSRKAIEENYFVGENLPVDRLGAPTLVDSQGNDVTEEVLGGDGGTRYFTRPGLFPSTWRWNPRSAGGADRRCAHFAAGKSSCRG
jgi:hypothetical protein